MSHRNCTRLEKLVEVSALAADMWVSADARAEGFEDCIQLAGAELDGLLAFADDWDSMALGAMDSAAWAAHVADAVEEQQPALVDVPSRTRPGLVHTVDVRRNQCTCEAAQHGRRCWHLAEARRAA